MMPTASDVIPCVSWAWNAPLWLQRRIARVPRPSRGLHTVWTGKLDGKDYPITGDPLSDTRSFKLNGEKTIDMVSKKDGKEVGDGTIVVAADGKTRTVTSTIRNAKGVKVTSSQFYDKS